MLSKSDYKKYLESPFYLWLYKYRPDLLPPELVHPTGKFIEDGKEVDELSKGLFPAAVTIGGFGVNGWNAAKRAMASGEKVLIQPTVVAGEINSRADLLVYDPELNKWDIFEVKSSTEIKRGGKKSLKDSHIVDVAFQRICWEKAGVPIGRTSIIYVNKNFIRQGEVKAEFIHPDDPSKGFFIKEDITDEVFNMIPEVENDIPAALSVLRIPDDTDPKAALRKLVNPDEIEFLSKLDPEVLRLLDVAIPKEEGEDICETESIRRELDSLDYPLYYLDYETYSSAIPLFDGLHPYQQMPFQYSLHIQKTSGAEAEHRQFLATEKKNPVPELLKQLRKDIGDKGSVFVWFDRFEKTRNEEMAAACPEYAPFLKSVNERVRDLMLIFKNKLYRKKEFGKSNSLKVVAPVLVPELPYSELNIHEGGTASASWLKLVDGELSQAEKDDLYDDMLRYCERDTETMVKIVKVLRKAI